MAPRYDSTTKDFTTDANGVWKTCHPVDSQVQLGLCTKKGSFRATPEFGTDYDSIQYIGPETQARLERIVLEGHPVATLIANKDISVLSIGYEPLATGGMLVSVDYVNLRLDPNRIQRVGATLAG